jgi:hypothetical protein
MELVSKTQTQSSIISDFQLEKGVGKQDADSQYPQSFLGSAMQRHARFPADIPLQPWLCIRE